MAPGQPLGVHHPPRRAAARNGLSAGGVDELLDTWNFYSELQTPLSREQVAALYGALGRVDKSQVSLAL